MGKDEKSNIPVGDHIPGITGANIKHKGIVLVDDNENTNKSTDHGFSKGNIVASITLFGNIPTDCGGYFYGSEEEYGHGEIHTVIRDATFDTSNIFYHNAQLFEISRLKHKN